MKNQTKIIVQPEGDNVLIGSHFHVLKDESHATYRTDNIPTFFRYIKHVNVPAILYYDLNCISAQPKEGNRYGSSIAVLSLKKRHAMNVLIDSNEHQYGLDSFESFLNQMKPYVDPGALELLSNLRDFKVNRVQKVVRKKDRRTGEYQYLVSQEGAGNDDFNPPAKIKFEVPMFEHIPETFEVSMDFEFNFRPTDDDVRLTFMIHNLQFSELYKERHKEILEQYLKEQESPYFWGSLDTITADDSWKYQANPHEITE